MGKKNLAQLLSSITGKGTTMTAKSLAGVKTKLEISIRKLEDKDKLSAEEKVKLETMRKQLKDVKAEMADESSKVGRDIAQKASDRKSKPVSLKEELPPLKSEMQKGGMLKKPTANQKGLKKLPTAVRNKMGFMKRGGLAKAGNMDMRKGGMFYK
jgi:hypothetical protein